MQTLCYRPLNGVGVPPGYDQPLQPQPRARSRFHFANDDEPPAPAQAPLLGSLSSGSLGGYGGACGVPPAPFAGMPEWKQPNGVSAIPSPVRIPLYPSVRAANLCVCLAPGALQPNFETAARVHSPL